MEVILFQPEIPQNTGNIARTCAVTGTKLKLVRPLGFNLSSRNLKRAGLDYWETLSLEVVDHFEPEKPFYLFSTKGKRLYTDTQFEPDAQLIFGSETSGFSPEIYEKWKDHLHFIPMKNSRSLNLSNAVSIVLYEALRQQNFRSLK